ncbi:RRP15-like protein [Tanacetum coccineum]
MAEEVQMQEAGKGLRKRNIGNKKGKGKKKMKVHHGGSGQKVKMDGKMKTLFRKRARDYNSDDSDDEDDIVEEEEPAPPVKYEKKQTHIENRKEKKQAYIENEEDDEKASDEEMDDDEDEDGDEDGDVDDDKKVDAGNDNSDDEEGIIEHGIMKFSEGSTSFKKAFKKIVNRSGTNDVLGPVLSAHKNLVVKKLAEEAAEKKVKGDAKKEKTMLGEKGHVKPESFSVTTHEKLLIGVATKGVVKLFNAVSKAQGSQKGLNPLRSKDAKGKQSINADNTRPHTNRPQAATQKGIIIAFSLELKSSTEEIGALSNMPTLFAHNITTRGNTQNQLNYIHFLSLN